MHRKATSVRYFFTPSWRHGERVPRRTFFITSGAEVGIEVNGGGMSKSDQGPELQHTRAVRGGRHLPEGRALYAERRVVLREWRDVRIRVRVPNRVIQSVES